MVGEPARRQHPFLARRLADSPDVRARVEAAERLGISAKRFDGWEPREVTTHHYDRKGRLKRSVTRREVEWDEYEQGLMLAFGEYRSLTCPSCFGWLPDTTAPEPERGQRWRVTAGPPCQACLAVDITATNAAKNDKQAHLKRWRVERNEGV